MDSREASRSGHPPACTCVECTRKRLRKLRQEENAISFGNQDPPLKFVSKRKDKSPSEFSHIEYYKKEPFRKITKRGKSPLLPIVLVLAILVIAPILVSYLWGTNQTSVISPPGVQTTPPTTAVGVVPSYSIEEVAYQVYTLVNTERIKQGLSPLVLDTSLTNLASEHSQSMASHGYFSHERLFGERDFDAGQMPGTTRGENLSRTPNKRFIPGRFLSLEEVTNWAVKGWMESPGHRDNILHSRFTKTGVGVSLFTTKEGNDWVGYLYITQIFEGNLG